MGKLSEEEIRRIVQKASLLQKFGEGSTSIEPDTSRSALKELYAITDDLGLPRKFVYEAYVDKEGIPVQEPVIVDHPDFNTAEVMGFAHGTLDKGLLNELRGQLEYHFNTMGSFTHRRNKIVWKAKPSGISRYIASSSSPEAEFIQHETGTQIRLRQSLKTTHKLYVPNLAMFVVGFMMMAGGMFSQGTDSTPLIIIGGMITLASYLFSRFVKNRRNKRKKKLSELTEELQQSIERRLKASTHTNADQDLRVEIPESKDEEEESAPANLRSKLKE